MEKDQLKVKDDSDKKSQRINNCLAVIAIIVSIIAIVVSTKTSKELTEYQILQDRLPKIIGLNQEISTSVVITDKGMVDFSHVDKNFYPFCIPVYNVGVGIAQNCVLEWDEDSIHNAILQMKKLFEEESSIHTKEYSFFQDYGMSWFNYDYLFEIKRGELNSIIHRGPEGEFIYDSISCEAVRSPYLVPLIIEETEMHIFLPDGLSALLLEAANHGLEDLPSIELKVRYQDLAGNEFKKSLITSLSIIDRIKIDDTVYFSYYVSFEERI